MALEAVTTDEPHWNHPDVEDLYRPVSDPHPVFFGAYDWHSAVHGHWTLAGLVLLGASDSAGHRLLTTTLTPDAILRETATLESGVLDAFEIPYGMAWVTMLDRALAQAGLHQAHRALSPLTSHVRRTLSAWLGGLDRPNETGLHRNTAFALGLLRDAGEPLWSQAIGRIRDWWGNGLTTHLEEEPGPTDFLSPTLEATATTLAALEPPERARWLDRSLPSAIAQISHLQPVPCPDPSDGAVSHLLGLNLSRAYALRTIASMVDDPDLREAIERAEHRHRVHGLAALDEDHFAATHWIASFALRAVVDPLRR